MGSEWLGASHPAVQCLSLGVAVHHGSLPKPFQREVERLLREGVLTITIASPTLAQGLNLNASTLLLHSLYRNRNVIPAEEFFNVAGRAGRAFIDVEGQVIFAVVDQDRGTSGQTKARPAGVGAMRVIDEKLDSFPAGASPMPVRASQLPSPQQPR